MAENEKQTLPKVGDSIHFEPALCTAEESHWSDFYGDNPRPNHGEVIEVSEEKGAVLVEHHSMGPPQWVSRGRIRSVMPAQG